MLEDFLKGKPLNERLARLKEAGDEDDPEPVEEAPESPIDDADREQIRRLLTHAGWQVLLKLLDMQLNSQEDAARRDSLNSPLQRANEIALKWAQLAADKNARNKIVALAESEAETLKATKAKKKNGGTLVNHG
jgi:hypothetical protein